MAFADPTQQVRYDAFRLFLNAYKLERGCIDCGYKEHPAALEFDHRDRTVKCQKVSDMWSYSKERQLAEMEKCDIRCANCHQIKTFEERENGTYRTMITNMGKEAFLEIFSAASVQASAKVANAFSAALEAVADCAAPDA